MHSDAGKCSVLPMLGLTSDFDTVDSHIVLDRLRYWVGVSWSALLFCGCFYVQTHSHFLPAVCHKVLFRSPCCFGYIDLFSTFLLITIKQLTYCYISFSSPKMFLSYRSWTVSKVRWQTIFSKLLIKKQKSLVMATCPFS